MTLIIGIGIIFVLILALGFVLNDPEIQNNYEDIDGDE